jgi:hypothetical protein
MNIETISRSIAWSNNSAPMLFMNRAWKIYQKIGAHSNSGNGKAFEECLSHIFEKCELTPFYKQASIDLIPVIKYDFVFAMKNDTFITISAKTSLRERWRQADLESYVVKTKYHDSKSYLITLSYSEASARNKNKKDWLGLEEVIIATSDDFISLIRKLERLKFILLQRIRNGKVVKAKTGMGN